MATKAGRVRLVAGLALTLGLTLALTGCAGNQSAAKPKLGVILPNSDTASRWQEVDGPTLENQLRANDTFDSTVENIVSDPNVAATTATKMLNNGVKVLVFAAATQQIATAITRAAKTRGVPTVGYDLTGAGVAADYVVTPDYRKIGELQGRGWSAGCAPRRVPA